MTYEFKQINASGNGTTTTCYIVQNPRIENGMNVAEVIGTFAGFSAEYQGEYVYAACQPRKMIFGGNFTMVEFTRELISSNAKAR